MNRRKYSINERHKCRRCRAPMSRARYILRGAPLSRFDQRRRLVSAPSSAASGLSLIGTWKLKSIESTSKTAIPITQEATTRFLPKEDGIEYINDSVFSDGQKTHAESTLRLDGRPYPLTGSLLGDAWSARQTGSDTYEAIITRDGVVSAKASATVSADRRTMTTEWEIVPATGPTITYVSLAERQG